MADDTTARCEHSALTAATIDTVTVTAPQVEVCLTNRTGADEIYFTIDGTAPTVGGQNCFVLPAAICSRTIQKNAFGATVAVVKLISAGTDSYSVESL